MLKRLRQLINRPLRIEWARRDDAAWLTGALAKIELPSAFAHDIRTIEEIASAQDERGQLPLWERYGQPGATRKPSEVRSMPRMGRFFTWLTTALQPDVLVEVGTAFGVSGMYWLTGLERNRKGELLTFDPNETWLALARESLARVGSHARVITGTVEEQLEDALAERPIDLAFIDGIHKGEFVLPQMELVLAHAHPGTVVLFDDIDFSDDMAATWRTIAADPRFSTAAAVEGRVGIVEVR